MRVLVVAEQRLKRQCLRELLADEPDIEVVGEAGDGWLAVPLVCKLRPDVVLMVMPVADALAATRLLHAECPSVRVIGLAMDDLFDAEPLLEAGARAYVMETDSPDVLLGVIRRSTRC